jgi:hypothetical protein
MPALKTDTGLWPLVSRPWLRLGCLRQAQDPSTSSGARRRLAPDQWIPDQVRNDQYRTFSVKTSDFVL